jgi:hypothetical protein
MSLKYFHLIFIALSIITTVGFGLWALMAHGLPSGFRAMGWFSLFLGGLLSWYGVRFFKKSKSIII